MFQLPKLSYDYSALEPHIDARTMEIHHTKHHQGYTDKLNTALEAQPELFEKTIEEILSNLDQVKEEIRTAVQNNGGGYANHKLFWEIMSPDAKAIPEGELADKISSTFGSLDEFKTKFSEAAATRFGSGWAWLVKSASGELEVLSTPNQDSPLSENKTPIMGLDVWEHAYYLNYQNRRPDYITAWWNVLDWQAVEKKYTAA